MNSLIIAAVVSLGMAQQTDTTFALDGAEALEVETMGGSITVDVWDEDRVRVRAEHSSRTFVEIDRGQRTIRVESEARRGPANLVDYQITVPRALELDLESHYGDIVVTGSEGAVRAETLRGEVSVTGGRGSVRVSNMTGDITVDGAEGRIDVESVSADIRVMNSSGEIFAETVGGTIVVEDATTSSADIGVTGGRVLFDGTFAPSGTYFFGAFGGSITIVVPVDAAASFNVATVHGSITSNLSGEAESFPSGERHEFTVGGGGAVVEVETFGGRIRLMREGTEDPAPLE